MKLTRDFYCRDALTVARELLGKELVRKNGHQEIRCRIVETEAYMGPEDRACHAWNNKRTKRTEVMFHSGGKAYIYFIYGSSWCLNIVTGMQDTPEAVLIRAVEPVAGLDHIRENREIKSKKKEDLCNGPGKLCKALALSGDFNGYDLIGGNDLYITEGTDISEEEIKAGKRINIDYAGEYRDKPWRFWFVNNSWVSVKER